jgi:DNA repair exonuclease SbcCD ATPase subunit
MRHAPSARTRSTLAAASILAGLSVGLAPQASGQEASADAARVVQQLEGIRSELKSIGQLLAAVEEHQRVTALMTRIRLKQQRLSSIEDQLRSARGEREGMEQEIDRLTALERSYDGRDGDKLGEEERRGLELMRQEKKNLESRVETLRMRTVELENELAGAQKEILALEEAVDELLGLR